MLQSWECSIGPLKAPVGAAFQYGNFTLSCEEVRTLQIGRRSAFCSQVNQCSAALTARFYVFKVNFNRETLKKAASRIGERSEGSHCQHSPSPSSERPLCVISWRGWEERSPPPTIDANPILLLEKVTLSLAVYGQFLGDSGALPVATIS